MAAQSPTEINKQPLPPIWRERIHKFSWQWHAVVMSTGVCSSLAHNFPYASGSFTLEVLASGFLVLDLVISVLLLAWAVARCMLFPEDRASIITDPAKSIFIGFFANGLASLINAALTESIFFGIERDGMLYTLWGLWWIDCVLSCAIAFGLVYALACRPCHHISKIGPALMVPIITLIVASASGGLFTRVLIQHSRTYALATTAVSLTMLAIGISLTMMLTTAFLLRLLVYGPLEATVVLATFTTLMPLGQGGFSILLNGQNLPLLFPDSDPDSPVPGRLLFSVCLCGAYILWSMGLAWIAVACFSIRIRHDDLPRFNIGHWCMIVPLGSFALLSLQLATVLKSPFFRVFGACWTCLVFALWVYMFVRSIPAIFDGSIFGPASPPEPGLKPPSLAKIEIGNGAIVFEDSDVGKEDKSPLYTSPTRISPICTPGLYPALTEQVLEPKSARTPIYIHFPTTA